MALNIVEPGQLAHCQSVTHRNHVIGRERKLVGIGWRPFDIDAVDWVRAIENEDRKLCLRGFFHHITERGDVSVEARAHILNVVDQRVEIFQLLRPGPPRFSVERIDWQAGLFIFRV